MVAHSPYELVQPYLPPLVVVAVTAGFKAINGLRRSPKDRAEAKLKRAWRVQVSQPAFVMNEIGMVLFLIIGSIVYLTITFLYWPGRASGKEDYMAIHVVLCMVAFIFACAFLMKAMFAIGQAIKALEHPDEFEDRTIYEVKDLLRAKGMKEEDIQKILDSVLNTPPPIPRRCRSVDQENFRQGTEKSQ